MTSVISHPTKTGQTLLHLAASLNFPSLVEFLIQHDISLDAQDINEYTALHTAVLSGSSCCMSQIVNAGADISICTTIGYTALELVPEDFFVPLRANSESQSEESDDESHFGDAEEDFGEESRPHSLMHSRRRIRHPRSRHSSIPASVVSDASDTENQFDVHAAVEDDDNATVVSPEILPMADSQGKDGTMDEKQVASFATYLQRAWAQFQPPQLRPQMPQLPGMPAWVFPVFVPVQAWPPFRTEKHDERNDERKATNGDDLNSLRAPWENWMTQMTTAMLRQDQLDEPILGAEQSVKSATAIDGRSVADDLAAELPVTPTPAASRSILRHFRYNQRPVQVTEKEVQAYSYRPKTKSFVKTVKKEVRMLVIFWLPVSILALIWALYAPHPTIPIYDEAVLVHTLGDCCEPF